MKQSNKLGALTVFAALAATLAAPSFAANDKVRVIVAFDAGKAMQAKAAVAAARGNVVHEIYKMNAMAVEVPAQALAGLQNNPHLLYVEEDVKRYPLALTTPGTGSELIPYGIQMVQADQVSAPAGMGKKICIIDSGIDRSHEDLGLQALGALDGTSDSGTGNWYTDENHHGTHVAGTIGALGNGIGVVGVSRDGRIPLHIIKVFGKDGWAYSSTLASAANKCVDGGVNAKVISMSLGGARASRTEEAAFSSLQSKGVLSIAAAGNAGNRTQSYPAGYASVVSVAAVDEAGAWASFSQYNKKVELAAPGVAVLSTVPTGSGAKSAVTVGATSYAAGDMEGSPKATATGALADFGIGDTVNAAVSGKVCLIQRGSIDFATKVSNCQSSGGIAAVIYNNVAGGFAGTLGTTVTTIPSVSASDTDGAAMKTQLGQSATVKVEPYSYAYYDGTSMATPHVSAVAALVWSNVPKCTVSQLRNALGATADDKGTKGRDEKYGYGIVKAKAALDYLVASGCNN